MPTRLFHLLARTAGERVRIIDGEGPRAFPEMVIYSPPEDHEWPENYLFRPARGDVLEISDTYKAPAAGSREIEVWYKVPFIDETDLRIYVCPGIRARSTIVVTAETANEQALDVMRLRMRDWLEAWNEWSRANPLLLGDSRNTVLVRKEYSRTSMAAAVAPWLDDLGQARALCERAGWPEATR